MGLIPGNLLSYNHQSVETSIGNWADFANGASSVVQSNTRALEGTQSILSTRNATAGDVAMAGLTTTGQAPVVAPGITYLWSFWVWTSVANTVWHAQNDFYQSNNTTFISTVTGPDITVPASTWTEIRAYQTAPALAGVARLFIQCRSGLASTNTANFDQMFFGFPQAYEPDRLFQPTTDPVSIAPWAGAPDASHDVITYAQTARISFVAPSTRPWLLLALSSEGFRGATAITKDDPYAISPSLLTPDDVTGGMQPWAGAPDSITISATTANAGVATITFAAQSAIAGVGALPGAASITFAAQSTTAGVAAGAGAATIVFTGQGSTAGAGALPGASSITFAAQSTTAGVGALPTAAPVTFAAQGSSGVGEIVPFADHGLMFTPDDLTGGVQPWGGAVDAPVSTSAAPVAGVAAITFTASGASNDVGALPGTAAIAFSAQGSTAGTGALAGAAAITFVGQSASTGLSALPGTASITFAGQSASAGLGAQPGTPTISLLAQGASTQTVDGPIVDSGLMFTPDDLTGGVAPWEGAREGVITGNTSVVAGVASVIIAAQGAVSGLSSGAGVATVMIAAQGPTTAGIAALPGSAAVTITARQATGSIGAGTGSALITFTAQNPSAAFSGAASAGVAQLSMAALGASPGVTAVPGTASLAVSARGPVAGVGARPGNSVIIFAAEDTLTEVPQAGNPTLVFGREPDGSFGGREATTSIGGRESTPSLIFGRTTLSSTSGTEPGNDLSGREP